MTAPIRAKKSLGQNFLKDPFYLRRITEAAQVVDGDRILEIGPGLGHLTRMLAERAGKVLALELDERLIPHLLEQFSGMPNVEIVHADALEYPYDSLPGTWKIVANLPYYISTPIIQKLLASRNRFTSLTLMLQKEVAERIAALPGGKEYGFLSLFVQLYSRPSVDFPVPAGAFTPKPKVDSSVVTLTIRDHPVLSSLDETFFMRVIKTAFSQRRKTLKNALKQLEVAPEKMSGLRDATGIDSQRRPETLSVEEFSRLTQFLRS